MGIAKYLGKNSEVDKKPIIKKSREVDGIAIETVIKEIFSFNSLEVEAGTNGVQGGDAGHGSRTYFRISDDGATNIEVNKLNTGNGGFEVCLGGDSELETTIKALEFILKTLKKNLKKNI